MTKTAVIESHGGFLAIINLFRRSMMPSGVYDRSVKMTADQKRKRLTEHHQKWVENNRERANAIARKSRQKRKEKVAAANKKWREENREENLRKKRQHYAENRERLLKEKKAYSAANRKRIAAYMKQYRKDHPEVFAVNDLKRRRVLSGTAAIDRKSISEWVLTWSNKKTVQCHWCKKRVKTSDVHIDHVVPIAKDGQNSLENLCVSCAGCNRMKHAKLPEVWNKSLKQPLLFL